MNGHPKADARARWGARILALAVGVIAVDLLLVAGNLIHLTVDEPHEATHPIFSFYFWNAEWDHSFAEIFGYLKLAVSAAVLIALRRRRGAVFGALALIIVVILADELLRLHDRSGALLESTSADFSVAGIGPQEVGELAFWVATATPLAVILLVSWRKANRADRGAALEVVSALALLAFFAVGVDMLHSALNGQAPPLVVTLVALIENLGELGAMTLLLIVLLRMAVSEWASSVPAEAEQPAATSLVR